MNAKLVKKLRKIATGMVVAAEQQDGKKIPKVGYTTDKKGTVQVSKQSWKGAYIGLKNGIRKSPRLAAAYRMAD